MDIKLVSFADKVTGASDATGKVSADDVNQLKKILNAIVSALFPLDASNTATSAVIKSLALPAVDIFDDFNPGDFTVSNGVISLANGTSLPVPPPLTNGLVDDNADTFTATLPAGYAVTDLERTFDGGSTWAAITALPISVGNAAFAVGQVGLRVKANSERQHSTTLFNQSAFTITGGSGNDPDAGFSKVILGSNDTLGVKVTQQAAPNNNSYDYANASSNGADPYGYIGLKSPLVHSGGIASWRGTVPTAKNSIFLGVQDRNPPGTINAMIACLRWLRGSNTTGRFQSVINGNYTTGDNLSITVPPRMQVRLTGTRIYLEYSLDGGTTWVDFIPGTIITQPSQDLYLTGYMEGYNSPADDAGLINIIQSGLQV